jgi:para-nitrobenzyl esterase
MRLCVTACLVLATLLIARPGACGHESPPVGTANGETLSGAWEAGKPAVAVFRGIPFAAPPEGRMRWRAPAPHRPRSGPQQATEFAPACMQGTGGVDWYVGVAAAFGQGPEVV